MQIILETTSKTFQYTFALSLLVFAIVLFAAASYSWTGPTGTAPANNVSAPINVGTASQVKSGALSVDGLSVYGSQYVSGHLGVGTGPNSSWKIVAQNGTYGIYADATSGQAIRGNATTGYAGYFTSGSSPGVYGESASSYGGYFNSGSSLGVYGVASNSYGGYFVGYGGVYAQNTSGYYAFLGYPGSSWSVYANGPTYTASYSRADGGFCIGGSCKTSWGRMGGSYWTGWVDANANNASTCASGYIMTGIQTGSVYYESGWTESNWTAGYKPTQRILCTSLAP